MLCFFSSIEQLVQGTSSQLTIPQTFLFIMSVVADLFIEPVQKVISLQGVSETILINCNIWKQVVFLFLFIKQTKHIRKHGTRTKETYEALQCAKTLDAGQNGWNVGPTPFHWASQTSRVSSSYLDTSPAPQVRLDRSRSHPNLHAKACESRPAGTHRPQLPSRFHGRYLFGQSRRQLPSIVRYQRSMLARGLITG